MGCIYTVSPEYLDTLYKECLPYKYIDIIGYRDINKATMRLHLTNVKDILGYLVVSDFMPDYYSLMRFIRKIELTLNHHKLLVLVIKDRDSYEEFKLNYPGSLVNIRVISGFEILTDIILKNAIGTIYKTQAEPYLELVTRKEDDVLVSNKLISFNHLVPKNVTTLIRPVRKLRTLNETLKFDDFLIKSKSKLTFDYIYRVAFIKAHYGVEDKLVVDSPYDYMTTSALKFILKEVLQNAKET